MLYFILAYLLTELSDSFSRNGDIRHGWQPPWVYRPRPRAVGYEVRALDTDRLTAPNKMVDTKIEVVKGLAVHVLTREIAARSSPSPHYPQRF